MRPQDTIYASDRAWWLHHWKAVAGLSCALVTCEQSDQFDGPQRVPAQPGNNLRCGVLNTGGNSGFAALHLAVLRGAQRVLLLGYDMGATGGKRHFFGDHPEPLRRTAPYPLWLASFNNSPLPATEIINCSRSTALSKFPRMKLEDAI